MATENTLTTTIWGSLFAVGLVCLLIGGAVGHYAYPTVVEVEKEVITEVPIDYLVIDDIEYNTEDILELMGTKTLAESELIDLETHFEDEIREEQVTDIAKTAIEEDYIDDLYFDDDDFKDSDFKPVWVSFDLSEDEGDYEVYCEFIVMEYEDNELINQYNAEATLDVTETDVVKHLEIIPLGV